MDFSGLFFDDGLVFSRLFLKCFLHLFHLLECGVRLALVVCFHQQLGFVELLELGVVFCFLALQAFSQVFHLALKLRMVLLELGQLLLLFGIYLGRVFYLSSLEGVFCPQLFHKRFQLGAVLLQNLNVLFEVRNSCLGLLEAGVLFSQLALLGVFELLLQFSDRAFELFSL